MRNPFDRSEGEIFMLAKFTTQLERSRRWEEITSRLKRISPRWEGVQRSTIVSLFLTLVCQILFVEVKQRLLNVRVTQWYLFYPRQMPVGCPFSGFAESLASKLIRIKTDRERAKRAINIVKTLNSWSLLVKLYQVSYLSYLFSIGLHDRISISGSSDVEEDPPKITQEVFL